MKATTLNIILVPVLASLLTGCGGPKIDAEKISSTLQTAVETADGYIDGDVFYESDLTNGKEIGGTVTVDGETEDAVKASLNNVLDAAAHSVTDVEFPEVTTVSVSAHPASGNEIWVDAKDIVPHPEGQALLAAAFVTHYAQ